MFHRSTKLVRPWNIMKIRLILFDDFMGKMSCSAIFDKYIALGRLQ